MVPGYLLPRPILSPAASAIYQRRSNPFNGGDVNLHTYVWNSPVSFSDPIGLWGFTGGVGATGAFRTYAGTIGPGLYIGSGGFGVCTG